MNALVRAYVRSRGFCGYAIESYDAFMTSTLPALVDALPSHKIDGLEIRCGKISVDPPPTPFECRARGTTYGVRVWVQIFLKIHGRERDIPEQQIGIIPLLRGSTLGDGLPNKCENPDAWVKTRVRLQKNGIDIQRVPPAPMDTGGRTRGARECEHDPGGYFIVKGNEYVFLVLEQPRMNVPIRFRASQAKRRMWVSETGSDGTPDNVAIYADPSYGPTVDMRKLTDPPLRLMRFLRALGETRAQEEIFKGWDDVARWLPLLKGQEFEDDHPIPTDADYALLEIGRNLREHTSGTDAENIARARMDLRRLLSHLGDDPVQKRWTLLKETHHLLRCAEGLEPQTDRNSFLYKRLSSSGESLERLSRRRVTRWWTTVYNMLKKKARELKKPWTAEMVTTAFETAAPQFSRAMEFAFVAGLGTSRKSGSTHRLDRGLNLPATISALRRTDVNIMRDGRDFAPRYLHSSQWGMVCAAETPEGKSVGLSKNLCVFTEIAPRGNAAAWAESAKRVCAPIYEINDPSEGTDVLLNGRLMGRTTSPEETLDSLKNIKRIDPYTSVSWDGKEIRIDTTSGRLVRAVRTRIPPSKGKTWSELLQEGSVAYVDSAEQFSVIVGPGGPYDELVPWAFLGTMVARMPFPQHNQGPRIQFHGEMKKAAIGIGALNERFDRTTHSLSNHQAALCDTLYSREIRAHELPTGHNAVVAVVSHPFNQEDALVIKRSSIDRGLFVSSQLKNYSEVVDTKLFLLCVPDKKAFGDHDYGKLDADGVVAPGTRVSPGDVLIAKIDIDSGKDCSIVVCTDNGVVETVVVADGPISETTRSIHVKVRIRRRPVVGDKFASRYGQKGVCALIIADIDMMVSQSSRTSPDILMNPNSLPSRMTIGHILEMLTGKTVALRPDLLPYTFHGKPKGEEDDDTDRIWGAKSDFADSVRKRNVADCSPFSEDFHREAIQEALKEAGFHPRGVESFINGENGDPVTALIFTGIVYYERLRHLSEDKINAQQKVARSHATRQPIGSRSKNGGQRFGEMEGNAVVAHGASAFLSDRIRCDHRTVKFCRECGSRAVRSRGLPMVTGTCLRCDSRVLTGEPCKLCGPEPRCSKCDSKACACFEKGCCGKPLSFFMEKDGVKVDDACATCGTRRWVAHRIKSVEPFENLVCSNKLCRSMSFFDRELPFMFLLLQASNRTAGIELEAMEIPT